MNTTPLDATATTLAWAAGLAVALLVGLLVRSVLSLPPDNRAFYDHPPWGFRCVWWPIRWLAAWATPWWPQRWSQRLQNRLNTAGLSHRLTPMQYQAARWVAAGAGALLWGWMAAVYAAHGVGLSVVTVALLGAGAGYGYVGIWLKDRTHQRQQLVVRALPFFLDTITLCVEAGLNFQGALQQAVTHGPPGPLRDEFQRVLRDVRAGKSRADSLEAMALRLNEPAIHHLCNAVLQAERLGMSLGAVLRSQADQRRQERFLRAEKRAMQAPVKMLLPLIVFIFPSTFIVLFFPIAIRFMQSGF